jgi:hypothetical protein
MTIDAIIGKFLDDEALLDGGRIAVREVVEELSGEGITVHSMTVANVQTIIRHVLAMQRERVAAHASRGHPKARRRLDERAAAFAARWGAPVAHNEPDGFLRIRSDEPLQRVPARAHKAP